MCAQLFEPPPPRLVPASSLRLGCNGREQRFEIPAAIHGARVLCAQTRLEYVERAAIQRLGFAQSETRKAKSRHPSNLRRDPPPKFALAHA